MVEEINVPESDGKSESVAVDNAPKPLFSIEIVRLLRDAQKQHGLRHGDFQRYRGKLADFNKILFIPSSYLPIIELKVHDFSLGHSFKRMKLISVPL